MIFICLVHRRAYKRQQHAGSVICRATAKTTFLRDAIASPSRTAAAKQFQESGSAHTKVGELNATPFGKRQISKNLLLLTISKTCRCHLLISNTDLGGHAFGCGNLKNVMGVVC